MKLKKAIKKFKDEVAKIDWDQLDKDADRFIKKCKTKTKTLWNKIISYY